MTRDEVIQILKENGDAFISEAKRVGVQPEDLWSVFYNSFTSGADRCAAASEEIAILTNDAVEPNHPSVAQKIDDLRAALFQALTASSLLIELLPPPPDGSGIVTQADESGNLTVN